MTADTITALKKALEGVTPGEWQVITDKHPWRIPGDDIKPAREGEHTERRIATVWRNPQSKDFDPVVNMSFGIGVDDGKARPMVHIKEEDARYIAAVNPEAISELLSTLESLQRENVKLKIDASNHAADAETVRRERDAADARESNLRAALTKLERDASEVSRRGAIPGNQWTLLTVSLIKARTALSSTGDTHGN